MTRITNSLLAVEADEVNRERGFGGWGRCNLVYSQEYRGTYPSSRIQKCKLLCTQPFSQWLIRTKTVDWVGPACGMFLLRLSDKTREIPNFPLFKVQVLAHPPATFNFSPYHINQHDSKGQTDILDGRFHPWGSLCLCLCLCPTLSLQFPDFCDELSDSPPWPKTSSLLPWLDSTWLLDPLARSLIIIATQHQQCAIASTNSVATFSTPGP